MRFQGRLKRLERPVRQGAQRKVVRIIVSGHPGPVDLARSSCTRRINVPGTLMEIVELHGCVEDLSPNALEAFVERFPIEDSTNPRLRTEAAQSNRNADGSHHL